MAICAYYTYLLSPRGRAVHRPTWEQAVSANVVGEISHLIGMQQDEALNTLTMVRAHLHASGDAHFSSFDYLDATVL